jgi:hypothetical protein
MTRSPFPVALTALRRILPLAFFEECTSCLSGLLANQHLHSVQLKSKAGSRGMGRWWDGWNGMERDRCAQEWE